MMTAQTETAVAPRRCRRKELEGMRSVEEIDSAWSVIIFAVNDCALTESSFPMTLDSTIAHGVEPSGIRLSLVIPCYDEREVLPETHRRLLAVLEKIGLPFELVYVDDGSHDNTLEILRQFRSTDGRVRVIGLSRNFGHQMAVSAGLEYAAGEAIVIVDADL